MPGFLTLSSYYPINVPIRGQCMVCGDTTTDATRNPDGAGRPRRFCSDRCKQRGYRLRRAKGDDWWRTQPWRVEFDRNRAKQHEAEQAAAKLKADALTLLPPEVRDRIRKAEHDQWMHNMATATKQMQRAERRWKVTQKLSSELLAAVMAGKKLRFGDPCDDEQLAGVLNHAVACESNIEAQAFFDKARRLWRDGADPS